MKKIILLLLVTFIVIGAFAQGSVVNANQSAADSRDTALFNSEKFYINSSTRVDQLLSKMKGFEIGDDGTVFHDGQQINRAKINGKDYTGLAIAKVIRHLQADKVQSIAIIDDGPPEKLTDVAPGHSRDILNILINDDGPFYNPALAGNKPYRLRNRQMMNDDEIYGNRYNQLIVPGSHNPLDIAVDRAIVNLQAVSSSMYDVDEYGDRIPHFIIKEWPGPKSSAAKKTGKDLPAIQHTTQKPDQPTGPM